MPLFNGPPREPGVRASGRSAHGDEPPAAPRSRTPGEADTRPGYEVGFAAPEERKVAYAAWSQRILDLLSARAWDEAAAIVHAEHEAWQRHFPYTVYADQMIDRYVADFRRLGDWAQAGKRFEDALLGARQASGAAQVGAVRALIHLGMLRRYFHRFSEGATLLVGARALDPVEYAAANGMTDPHAL